MGYLLRQKSKLNRQMHVLKGQKDSWTVKEDEENLNEAKSGLKRLQDIVKDINLLLEEVELEEN